MPIEVRSFSGNELVIGNSVGVLVLQRWLSCLRVTVAWVNRYLNTKEICKVIGVSQVELEKGSH